MTVDAKSNSIFLQGLDGSNPLAFLAALGTFRTLTSMHTDLDLRMRWVIDQGAWRPELCSPAFTFEQESLCDDMADWLAAPPQLELLNTIGDNLTMSPSSFHQLASGHFTQACEANADSITALEVLAAFGSDATYQPHSKDHSLMQDTALRTMSGAGHQHFIKFMREIIANTSAYHLQTSLFLTWAYQDEGRGMNLRWDPIDDRRYAMRWRNPSSDPAMTMRGANRLAIEAMPFFPTAATGKVLQTTGFKTIPRRGTFWSWPIWTIPVRAGALRSLLQHSAVTDADATGISELGIAAVFRSQRITVGKFRNFTPAKLIG